MVAILKEAAVAFEEMLEFVSERNAVAALALAGRRDALLAFHRQEQPSTLNTTFLSTNLIENVLWNWRKATGNVKRWNEKDGMSLAAQDEAPESVGGRGRSAPG